MRLNGIIQDQKREENNVSRHPQVPHPKDLMVQRESFDRNLARKLGAVLGNMKFFYFCVILDLAMLPAVILAGSVIAWVTYIAQTVIQLLALPVLQVYQNLITEASDAKADADHMALTHIAQVVDEIRSWDAGT
jgi:hypothetical protein